jgi:hypothetical protein
MKKVNDDLGFHYNGYNICGKCANERTYPENLEPFTLPFIHTTQCLLCGRTVEVAREVTTSNG